MKDRPKPVNDNDNANDKGYTILDAWKARFKRVDNDFDAEYIQRQIDKIEATNASKENNV